MANSNGWGDGAANNSIGWGQGANNAIAWGDSHAKSWAGDTDIVGFDGDAQAFITAAAITDPVQINAINTLVKGMKTDGIWTKMKAIYPFVGGTASAHKWNLKDPRDLDAAFRLVFNGGWTHSAQGALPNGTNGYADTKLVPSSNLISGNTHASVYIRTNTVAGNKQELGSFSGPTSEYSLISKLTGDLAYPVIGGTIFPSYSNSNSQGFWVINRENTTNIQYYNRSTKVVDAAQINGMSTRSIYLGARNATTVVDRYSDRQTAFSTIGDGLTATEAANLYTRVQAFQTALSRQV